MVVSDNVRVALEMEFNRNLPNVIHLDINSCFATIEQQANPLFRDKPVVVASYTAPSGCVLAASVTAKRMGIKTGMKVMDARKIDPAVIVLLPDPPKYRFVHQKILRILKRYSDEVIPKSIDEFVFKVANGVNPVTISKEIKQEIKSHVGEYITVSIGISTNSYLAKVASNLQKPDGLSEINSHNFLKIFSKLKLTDLTGIKKGNSTRLRLYGIKTVVDFYKSPVWRLRLAFGGIGGFYWYLRLHGYEIDIFKSKKRTIGNSYAPPPDKANEIFPIISKLCEKTGFRLRKGKLKACGVYLSLQDRDGNFWHMRKKLKRYIFSSNDINYEIKNLFGKSPIKKDLKNIAICTYNLSSLCGMQLEMFEDINKKTNLAAAVDVINEKWGLYTIHPASTITDPAVVQDRISFGQL